MLHARQNQAQWHFHIEVQRRLPRCIQLRVKRLDQLNDRLSPLQWRGLFGKLAPRMPLQHVTQRARAHVRAQQVRGQRSIVFHPVQFHIETLQLVERFLRAVQPLRLAGIGEPVGECGVVLRI